RLVAGLGLKLGYAPWLDLWNDTFEPNEPMQNLLKELRGQVRIWGLSNTNVDHLGLLKAHFRVLDSFEGVTASCDVGARKPETAIYVAALKSLGLAGSEVLYLDDVEAYACAAESLGIRPFHYTFNDSVLRQSLKGMGFALA
ncbi:MAG: HAD family hydrolase, partial [bacterium]